MMRMMSLDAQPTQTEPTPHWEEGRAVDMAAFDQLPRMVRNYLNEHTSFYPIEDVLHEHLNDHGGDAELTMVWLLECQDLEVQLGA